VCSQMNGRAIHVETPLIEAMPLSPFDDPFLWQGHATLIDEVLGAGLEPDAVVLSVGGEAYCVGLRWDCNEQASRRSRSSPPRRSVQNHFTSPCRLRSFDAAPTGRGYAALTLCAVCPQALRATADDSSANARYDSPVHLRRISII
jgi:hypothetical protein